MGAKLLAEWCEFMRAKGPDGERLHINDIDESLRELVERQGRMEKERCLEEKRTPEDVERAVQFFKNAELEDVLDWFDSLEVFEGFMEWRESKPRNMALVRRWARECIQGRGIHMRSLTAFRGHLSVLMNEPGFRWGDLNAHIMRLCPPGDLFASACRGELGAMGGFLSRCFVGLPKQKTN